MIERMPESWQAAPTEDEVSPGRTGSADGALAVLQLSPDLAEAGHDDTAALSVTTTSRSGAAVTARTGELQVVRVVGLDAAKPSTDRLITGRFGLLGGDHERVLVVPVDPDGARRSSSAGGCAGVRG